MTIDCFSQRLLNPFRGVMNVIRYRAAEAVTTDGVNWEIYVSNDELREGLDPHAHVHVQISDIRYGHWSLQDGLRRGPIYPSADFKRMEKQGAVVYDALLQNYDHLPFRLRDHFELWLLDREGQPLCLLHSEVFAEDITLDVSLRWRSGNLCAEQFRPPIATPESAAAVLGEAINALTAEPAVACWFQRQADGSAIALETINHDVARQQTWVAAERFPPFFVRTQHNEASLAKLVHAYLDWQAPWLLLLQNLEPLQRYDLEQRASKQALLVEQHYRLYPEIIDESFLRAARVEAMMRNAHTLEAKPESAMSTWYLELGDWSRGK